MIAVTLAHFLMIFLIDNMVAIKLFLFVDWFMLIVFIAVIDRLEEKLKIDGVKNDV